LEQAHEALAGEIETLKSARGSQLGPDAQNVVLDERLKRAKAMAADLAALDRRVTAGRAAYVQARSALVTALESEILRLQVSLSEVSREERLVRFERLRVLVEERRTLPAAPIVERTPVRLPTTPNGVVVSAEELRELVDETRDHAERVQTQLTQITTRVSALRERRRLLQAAVDFQRDESLFAESERNRRIVTGAREAMPTVQGPVRTGSNSADGNPQPQVTNPASENSDPDEQNAAPSRGGGGAAEPPAGESEADDGRNGDTSTDSASPDQDEDSASDGREPEVLPGVESDGDSVSELPMAVVSPHLGGGDVEGVPTERMVQLGDAFDPSILDGDVDDLSPNGVEQQIRALEARRGTLIKKREALSKRRKDLERRAIDAE